MKQIPLIIDMNNKALGVTVHEKSFSKESGIVTLQMQIVNYGLTGKTITAAFKQSNYETDPNPDTGPFSVVDNVISLVITADMVRFGNNNFQINFRTENSLEQSPVISWYINESISGAVATSGYVDALTSLINQVNQASDNANNLSASVSQTDTGATVTIVDKDGKQTTANLHHGVSPVITQEEIPNGYHITIRDTTGIHELDVLNGLPGYTPIKGTNYFTASEIAAIKTDIESDLVALSMIPAVSNIYTIDFSNRNSINIGIAISDIVAKTIVVINVPPRTEMYLELVYSYASAITWFFPSSAWQNGIVPNLVVGKTYRMAFFTSNGGVSWQCASTGGW
jgi:hypothetical protein